ncbi:D-inositol-3-phosphate glycosyltransferase [subsurface metagenome]
MIAIFWYFYSQLITKKFRNLSFLKFKDRLKVAYLQVFLKKTLNDVKPDLVHVHHFQDQFIFAFKIVQNNVPLVVTDHAFWHELGRTKYYEYSLKKKRCAANLVDYIIYVSKFSKKQMERFNIGLKQKKVLIYHPVSVEKIPFINKETARNELELPINKKLIFFNGISESVSRKGLDILLKSISKSLWLKKNCKIVIIANTEGIKFSQGFLDKIDIMPIATQPWEKIVKIYNAADLFVMPSRSESFGIVYIESLLVGVPVIGFYPIIKELENMLGTYIGEKFNADKENEEDLAEKIIKVLNMKIDRKLLRKKVIENLSWDVKFREFELIYRELLRKS